MFRIIVQGAPVQCILWDDFQILIIACIKVKYKMWIKKREHLRKIEFSVYLIFSKLFSNSWFLFLWYRLPNYQTKHICLVLFPWIPLLCVVQHKYGWFCMELFKYNVYDLSATNGVNNVIYNIIIDFINKAIYINIPTVCSNRKCVSTKTFCVRMCGMVWNEWHVALWNSV